MIVYGLELKEKPGRSGEVLFYTPALPQPVTEGFLAAYYSTVEDWIYSGYR